MTSAKSICVIIAAITGSAWPAEFPVNTRTVYNQSNPAIAIDAAGRFVLVWSSYRQDGDSGSIVGRRFGPDCLPATAEFQVNTRTEGNQTAPAIAMYPTGQFLVAWQGPGARDEDVYARCFDANCLPVAAEFPLGSLNGPARRFPRVAASPAGPFAAVWESRRDTPEGYASTIEARRFDADGKPLGSEFVVSQMPDCRYPDLAVDARGNLMVVWLLDKSTKCIMARLYDAQARPKTDAFQLNQLPFTSLTRPAVAAEAAGNFIVTWDGHPDRASMDDIHARWFGPDGDALTDQFHVNTTTAGAQQNPRVSITSQGRFVIVWNGPGGTELDATDVFAQRYNALVAPLGGQMLINRYTPDQQKYPVVAVAPGGKFVAAWQSYGQDGSGYGIFATSDAMNCPEDLNQDGQTNFADYCLFAAKWHPGTDVPASDLNQDGILDARDLAEFSRRWLSPCQRCDLSQ